MRYIGRFFLWVFAVVGFLIVVVAVSAATWFLIGDEEQESLPQRIVLSLDLNEGVSEQPAGGPFTLLSRGEGHLLRDVIAGLQKAQADDRVVGLVVRMGSSGVGIATAQEIRDAVARFRESGKFAVAYADSFSAMPGATSEYFLASGFDEVAMQPSGELAITGVAIEIPFVAGALEMIGVQPRMEQRKEYKSAVETFTRESMSQPARSNLQDLANSWLSQLVAGIAQGRNIAPEAARAGIDQSPLLAAEAVERRLVDTLDYWPGVVETLKARAGANSGLVALSRYSEDGTLPFTSGPTVALIHGIGPIVTSDGGGSPFDESRIFAAQSVAKAIADAVAAPEVKAILLRIDSPGGSYLASDTVWNAVMHARSKGKPVIASLGGIAASGGYFVAMAADRIVASPGTLTGSIGVYGGKFVTEDLWPKIGVHWDVVQAGKHATMWSPFRDFPPSAKARIGTMMDAVYADFTGKLAKGRRLSEAQVETVAGGRVWSGEAASQVGLVDTLGGFKAAIDAAKEAAGIKPEDDITLREFPLPQTPFEQLLSMMAVEGGGMAAWLVDSLGLRAQFAKWLEARFGPLLHELDALRPPVGTLQMPPMRVRY